MERMGKEKESGTLLGVGTAYLPVKEIKGEFYVKVSDFTRCMDSMRKELEEENKKLKSGLAFERTMLDNVKAEYKSLQNVKEKLNIKVASLEGEIKGLNYTIEKLKEENQTLELWLDNKEKLNEKYRKEIDQIDLLKCQTLGPSELADSLYDADKTIERLNGRIANLKEEVEDSHKIIEHYKNDKKLMEKQIKKLREELSKYKKQYQHSLGGDDELIYEEGLYD